MFLVIFTHTHTLFESLMFFALDHDLISLAPISQQQKALR